MPTFPRPKWGMRFFLHFLRLVGGPSAWVYLILAGLIVGFTGTYFTFRFLPFRVYTQPLLIDELLASIGFALYRILVPVLATVLIAARCGAAVAADVGVKQYGGQVDALRTLGVQPRVYLLVPIVMAFVIATPVLEWLAFSAARGISLLTFTAHHPSVGSVLLGSTLLSESRKTRCGTLRRLGLGIAEECPVRCRNGGNRLLSRHIAEGLGQRCESLDHVDGTVDHVVRIDCPFCGRIERVLNLVSASPPPFHVFADSAWTKKQRSVST